MRILGLIAIAVTGLGLTGCSQISSVFKKKPHYHTADGTTVYTTAEASLRTAPPQSYEFADQSYDVEIYDSASQYTGYAVELYDTQPSYSAAVYTDPRHSEFVKLNGDSDAADWRNCETLNRGYLFLSEYNFNLHPGFEVCMRNKGYVLSTEYNSGTKQTLSAQSVGLRGGFAQNAYVSSSSVFP